MLDGRMKELCRICARELCGNQRRWIFHPASKLNLQVLLSHVLGHDLTRDGRPEFACGKCAFMLERMYRFDTVIARVEALSIERLQRLLLEKERLRQGIGNLYMKTNGEEPRAEPHCPGGPGDCTVDMSDLPDAKYSALLQEDFAYSAYESWAEDEEQTLEAHHHCHVSESSGYRSRRCRGCAALRVADSDYEAVCRVPRKLARSISCGPSTRYSLSVLDSERSDEPLPALTPMTEGKAAADDGSPEGMSPASSVESLEVPAREEELEGEAGEELKSDSPVDERAGTFGKLALAFRLVKDFEYRPVQSPRGSRLPVLVKHVSPESNGKMADVELRVQCGRCCGPPSRSPPRLHLELPLEMPQLEDLWQDVHAEYMPFRLRKSLIEEQQTQLNQYECAAGQCVSELQKAQLQVQSLQARIHKSEVGNKKLQEKLCEMESELRSVRQASQQQERTIQGLKETAGTKDREAQELYSVIEGQKEMLFKLREVTQRHQLQHLQMSDREVAQMQRELLALQESLFSTQLELQGSQRAERRSQWRASDVARDRERLQADLEEALQHRAAAEQHNQELRGALQRSRSNQQAKEDQLKEVEIEKQAEVEAKDKTIQQLRISLRNKEQMVQEYLGLLDQQGPNKTLNTVLQKLKERIKERDIALERAIDDKFQCLEEKDGDTRRLQLALREKERDLERLRYVLSKNEETITTLEGVLRGRELELEQVREANKNLQWLKQEAEEQQVCGLKERDAIISQLRASLQSRAKEAEDLTAALLSKAVVDGRDALEELQLRLQLKERLFQEALSDRARQAEEHQGQVQELLAAIGTRDHYIKDSVSRLGQVISDRTGELHELRIQLAARELEVAELSQQREQQREQPNLQIDRLQSRLREKESFIRVLMNGTQDEPMTTSMPEEPADTGNKTCDSDSGLQVDIHAVRDELQLVLKKEKEAQLELSALRTTLAKDKEEILTLATELETYTRKLGFKEELIKDLQKQLVEPSEVPLVQKLTQELQELREEQGDTGSAGHQHVLEQLVSGYSRLNEAVRVEKRAYESLVQGSTSASSAEKTWELQRELDAVQSLRGQLETHLEKSRNAAVAPARAVKAQPDFGELSTEESDDDDDGGSSEFTDSIEEEETFKLTAQSLATNQIPPDMLDLHGRAVVRSPSQNAPVEGQGLVEVQQLVEQKKAVERELGELKSQLEKAGYSSLSQMRNAVVKLRAENSNLKGMLAQMAHRAQDRVEEGRPEEGEARGAWSGGELSPTQGKRSMSSSPPREGKRRCTRPVSLDLGTLLSSPSLEEAQPVESVDRIWQHVEAGLKEKARQLHLDLAQSQQESQELQERLMVSEATVQAQAEQLKDYRELLTETSVKQDSKQVQVDLQDLGYETCGRSENEAEREDTSSPEFDDLEMCTTLSRQDCDGQWWTGDCRKAENMTSLRQQVEDLRGQLSRSRATIRSLQGRLRSISSTGDCSSNLERSAASLAWSFQASPATSGPEDDEGWQSDGVGATKWPRPNRELRDLALRVTCLEDQLKSTRSGSKGASEDGKAAAWPGKFDTLIQAQARELSHLRQRVRVSRGVCRILSQHLDDTTKAFEELLRANDIDYYMGQSFREQLAQSSALAERVSANISGRDPAELLDDKMGHELLALRLSKELQQKDKIIESLRSKLKQQRPDTPSSSHALSETTNQSDRTSFISDEHGSTHGDLELGSEVDAASEYNQEDQEGRLSPQHTDAFCRGSTSPHLSPVPCSSPASRRPQSPSSCPSILCTVSSPVDSLSQQGLFPGFMPSSHPIPQSQHYPAPPGQREPLLSDPPSQLPGLGCPGAGSISLAEVHRELQTLQMQLADRFTLPHVKPLPAYSLVDQPQRNPSSYLPHHAFHQPSLSSNDTGTRLKAEPGLMDRGALWEMSRIGQPIRASAYGDILSGSSGYQSGTSHTGTDLMEEHLREIRSLRQRLEDSIRTNDRLRHQLEERLASVGRDGGAPTNIYIQGLDSLSTLSKENQALMEENLHLKQANRDTFKEAELLREALLAGRARLKQVELEVERQQEENSRLQALICEQAPEVQRLRQEWQGSQESISRLKHKVSLLQQQLADSQQLMRSLQCELRLYEGICMTAKGSPTGSASEGQSFRETSPVELGGLLAELRSLRMRLERSLQENNSLRMQLEEQTCTTTAPGDLQLPTITASGQSDNTCRRQLFRDPAPSPPVRDPGLLNSGSTYSLSSKSPDPEDLDSLSNDILRPHSELEGDAPDGSFANKNGRHTIGHVDDFNALQQQILEGKMLVHKMEAKLHSSLTSSLLEVTSGKALDHGFVKTLLASAKTLDQILEEATSLLKMFWRAALPRTENTFQHIRKEQSMKEEIHRLRVRITEQEGLLQDTIERLRSTNRTKESMEHFIVNQLSRTRDVLKKARTNLEKNEYKISTLSSSSSSPHPGEIPRRSWKPLPDWGFMKTCSQKTAGGDAKINDRSHQLQTLMF
ncbi:myomegalin isoform X4 [Paramormyrops kingsleyae]|uniref:myomegalin isoform X4 n=1 Tax=Paramormyrops kingsleyae TaxID=1676925 RepID=UPI000CD6107B|nr:myomegalin-like isoform X4 [Paramormyrops kingsleyae]